jgi:hypothetical protein
LNRQPLSFRDHPVALASSYPYVAALTTAGTVEIHSVFNPNSRNVSTFTFPSPGKAITSNGNLLVVATASQFYLLVSTTHKHRVSGAPFFLPLVPLLFLTFVLFFQYGDYETFVQIFQTPSSQRAAIKDYLNKILSYVLVHLSTSQFSLPSCPSLLIPTHSQVKVYTYWYLVSPTSKSFPSSLPGTKVGRQNSAGSQKRYRLCNSIYQSTVGFLSQGIPSKESNG